MSAELDREEQIYQDDVKAVKQWWTDSRWRFTKRPFTAEQIVAKRGNLKVQYPSNVQSKKLWKIVEERFKVRNKFECVRTMVLTWGRTAMPVSHTDVWTQPCSRKWLSILTPSTCLAGNARQLHLRRTSPLQILQTTRWYVVTFASVGFVHWSL